MLYVVGRWHQNEHLRETGLLAGEAVIDTYAVTSVLKPVFRRPRPYQDDGNGRFFQGGASFPSEHATASWAIASVLAHEYPGTFTKVTVYLRGHGYFGRASSSAATFFVGRSRRFGNRMACGTTGIPRASRPRPSW